LQTSVGGLQGCAAGSWDVRAGLQQVIDLLRLLVGSRAWILGLIRVLDVGKPESIVLHGSCLGSTHGAFTGGCWGFWGALQDPKITGNPLRKDMVRLTGRHPFNSEPPLKSLQEAPLIGT